MIGGLVLLVGPRQDRYPASGREKQAEYSDARDARNPSDRKTESTIWSRWEIGHQDWFWSFTRNFTPLHACPAFRPTKWSNRGQRANQPQLGPLPCKDFRNSIGYDGHPGEPGDLAL